MKNIKKLLAIGICFLLIMSVIQIPMVANAATVSNLLSNGTFDSDVSGWKVNNTGWGELSWDSDAKAANFKKLSASSGPTMYSEAVKVKSGEKVYLSYDYKTSVNLSGVATSVFIYGYTAETVQNKGSTFFTPGGDVYTYEFVNTTTDWQTKELFYTVPENCEYVQVAFSFRGAVAANVEWRLDNIYLYEVNEDFVLNKINTAVSGNDQTLFNKWISDSVLGIKNLNADNYADYFKALKSKNEITKNVIQETVNGIENSAEPKSLLSNGTFDSDVSGWKVNNTGWGELGWDSDAKAANFKKLSASSGPTMYSEAIKVKSGEKVYLSYDYKTSVNLTGVATSVFIYGYTAETVQNKGSTFFTPSGDVYTYEFVNTTTDWQTKELFYTVPENCEYVQVAFSFRGAVAANVEWRLDNIYLYEVNEKYVKYQIANALENNDLSAFNLWIDNEVLEITGLDPDKFEDYFNELKSENEITQQVIQKVVDKFSVAGNPISILKNGSFSADVSGWKSTNKSYGELSWDSATKSAKLEKLSATSGPTFYSNLVKVKSGTRVCLDYDYKTSANLTSAGTVVHIYAYTREFVESKGTTYFNPTGKDYTYEFVTSTTDWQTKEITYTVPENCEYVHVVFGFRGAIEKDTVLWIDNVKLYNIDVDFVLYKISNVKNKFELSDWMSENVCGLKNVTVANREEYFNSLSKITETLTKNKLQEMVDKVNKEREDIPILENGDFDTTILPWRKFNSVLPSAVWSAVDGGSASLVKEGSVSSKMLSEVIDVAYGDILHLEFSAKATKNLQLVVYSSQFTRDELLSYGENAGVSGKIANIKESQTFNISTQSENYVVDIAVSKDIYGYVAEFALEDGSNGTTVYIDNVVINRGTKEFVNNKLNSAIADENAKSFEKWMKHTNSGLVYETITVDDQLMSSLKAAKEKKQANLTPDEITDISKNKVTDIGTRLELFVDDTLIDTKNTTAELKVMSPKYEGQVLNCSGAFICDDIANEVYTGKFDPSKLTDDTRPWESLGSSGAAVMKVGDKYYCYYRGVDEEVQTVDRYVNGYGNHDPSVAYYQNVTLAISDDGITWTRPELGLYEFNYDGKVYDTNIIIGDIMENFEGRHLCSFSPFVDKSPNANPEKPYKAMMVTVMARGWGFDLFALESADGIHWDLMNNGKPVISNGRSDIMDSDNVAIWSEVDQEYKMYFRMWHNNIEYGQQRGISVITSKDFINWDDIDTQSVALDYYSDKSNDELVVRNTDYDGNHPDNYQFYTNSITTYERAPHIYIGMPTRYLGGNTGHETAPYFIAGRDGVNFKVWDAQLIEPSAELDRDGNRSNYADYPIFRTSETEYSFFATRGFKDSGIIYDRFSFRVDGFVSAVGDSTGKQIVTTPITFDGNKFVINYKATSGTVKAQLTDVDGNPLKGFTFDDCVALTGDSIEEELVWTGDLTKITQPVKICFELINAELYSYKFECESHSFTDYVSNGDATCTKDGTKTAKCENCDETKTITDEGSALGHKNNKTEVKQASTKSNGYVLVKCSRCGKEYKKTTIYKVNKIKLSTTTYTYNGKVKKPSVSVYDSQGKKLSSSNYTVTYASGRKNVGTYTVKVTLKGNYSGTLSTTFKINPASTSLKKLTAAKKSLKVTINKKSSQTTGYQIQYSTSKSFKNAKTKTVSSYKTTSVTIKSLKAKKTYYVRVRTYKTVNGKKYYSSWSSAKSKKTK